MVKGLIMRSGAETTVRQLEVAIVFSAPNFVVRVLIRFVDDAKVIEERIFLLTLIERFNYFISLHCLIITLLLIFITT